MKKYVTTSALFLGVALGLSSFAYAQPWGGRYGPWMMENWGWGPWLLGPIVMLLFWGVVIVAAVFAVRWLVRAGTPEQAGKSSLDILKNRFARGEIDQEEFELRRNVLAEE